MATPRPRARTEGLLVRELGDELVAYDLESHRSHCLNHTAALVWRTCDGRRTVAGIAERVGRELGAPAGEDLVRLGLRRLSDAGLLEAPVPGAVVTRRELARRIGRAALLPVIVSLLVPKPSEAASCQAGCPTCNCSGQPDGTTCWNGVDCVTYVCCGGACLPSGPCP